jgi:thiol-disulfide isomerase/thioredoxin
MPREHGVRAGLSCRTLCTTDRDPADGQPRSLGAAHDLRCVMPDKRTVVTCTNCGRRNRVPAVAPGTPRCGQCSAPLPWLTEAGSDDFDEVVMSADIPVLVDLWAPWCGPCRMVSPALEDLARDEAGRIKLVKVNVDEAPAIPGRRRGLSRLRVRRRMASWRTRGVPGLRTAEALSHASEPAPVRRRRGSPPSPRGTP